MRVKLSGDESYVKEFQSFLSHRNVHIKVVSYLADASIGLFRADTIHVQVAMDKLGTEVIVRLHEMLRAPIPVLPTAGKAECNAYFPEDRAVMVMAGLLRSLMRYGEIK